MSESGPPDAVLDKSDGESGTEDEEPGPAPCKHQRREIILELLERAEEVAAREGAREEILLNLLEKLMDKM